MNGIGEWDVFFCWFFEGDFFYCCLIEWFFEFFVLIDYMFKFYIFGVDEQNVGCQDVQGWRFMWIFRKVGIQGSDDCEVEYKMKVQKDFVYLQF